MAAVLPRNGDGSRHCKLIIITLTFAMNAANAVDSLPLHTSLFATFYHVLISTRRARRKRNSAKSPQPSYVDWKVETTRMIIPEGRMESVGKGNESESLL